MSNPFCHVELQTGNVERAKKFYSSLLDWKLEDVPMGDMTYTMVQVGEGTGGGMMQNPVPDGPAHWLAYIQVGDLDKTLKRASDLGATIVQEATEVPNFGRFSVLSDPTGAVVGLWEPAHAG